MIVTLLQKLISLSWQEVNKDPKDQVYQPHSYAHTVLVSQKKSQLG